MKTTSKQTAVDFLKEKLTYVFVNDKSFNDLFEQAKEMEKEQIMNAVYDSMGTNFDPNMGRAEQYYNEIYESND